MFLRVCEQCRCHSNDGSAILDWQRRQARWATLALACALATLGGPAWAQREAGVAPALPATASAMPASLTLEEFLRLVLQRSTELEAERLSVQAARADVLQAGLWPNPVLSAAHKPGETAVGIEQPLPIFGQIGQRKATAQQAEAKAAADTAVQIAQRLSEAGDAFIDAQMAAERERVWLEAQRQMREALRIVRGQVGAGARSRYDGERMALKLGQLDANLARAIAERRQAAASLGALVALPGWQPRAVGPLHPLPAEVYADGEQLWAQARERVPALKAAAAAVDLADQQLALRRKEALPTPSLSYQRVRSRNDGHYNQVGVSIELPLFDRKQGDIARAGVERRQAEYRQLAAEADAKSSLLRAVQQYQLRREALKDFEQHEREQHANLAAMADDAYRLGQGSILDYVDSLETLRERQLEKLSLAEDMLRAQWAIRQATGQLPVD